jgi:hypothetical protein
MPKFPGQNSGFRAITGKARFQFRAITRKSLVEGMEEMKERPLSGQFASLSFPQGKNCWALFITGKIDIDKD